jgi:hypothetical protein
MTDNPMDSLSHFDLVSIRAVLVHDGEDPSDAVSEAGIHDPIEVPVTMGEDMSLAEGGLGDGITPNLSAVLETERWDIVALSSQSRPGDTSGASDSARPAQSGTTTLPAAYGIQPLAPVRRMRG